MDVALAGEVASSNDLDPSGLGIEDDKVKTSLKMEVKHG